MNWVVHTNTARCRDCYRCVRVCPVKAVRVAEGQAQVVPELCLSCGSCVLACPQDAKVVRDDRSIVRRALAEGRPVYASVAPSAPAYFEMVSFAQMRRALLELGFAGAEETALGAEMVGLAHRELLDRERPRPLITSSCPAVVRLIEQYMPDLIPHLAPIVSPMIAHGRLLRARYGAEILVVFIGPCVAKKAEIEDPMVAGVVDAALTFAELEEWLAEEGVDFPVAEGGCEPVPERDCARLFPVEGGLVGTARMKADMLSEHLVVASGLEACRHVLEGIRRGVVEAALVELMACEGGCIQGPVLRDRLPSAVARQRVLEYAARRQPDPLPSRADWPDLARGYVDRRQPEAVFSEGQIREVLHRVGKFAPEDELNCGACGYDSCREKAIAVLRGMAEATMCVPYMRARAESLTNVVIEATPNPILIVDRALRVQDVSPSAERMFRCSRLRVRGMPLRELIGEVGAFLEVCQTGQPVLNRTVLLREDLVVEQTVVPVQGEQLVVGILRDVTERERQREELERIRAATLQRTQEVIEKQMRVAHEIAGLLGETTAETKVLLTQLARLIDASGEVEAGDR